MVETHWTFLHPSATHESTPKLVRLATSLKNLADLYRAQANYAAESLYQRALKICEKALGPGHPQTANSLHNLAMCQWDNDPSSLAIATPTDASRSHHGPSFRMRSQSRKADSIRIGRWESTTEVSPDATATARYTKRMQGHFGEASDWLGDSSSLFCPFCFSSTCFQKSAIGVWLIFSKVLIE